MNLRIALLMLLFQLTPAQPVAKATIEGTVIRAGTGAPVPGVRVTLTRPAEPRPATPASQTRPPAAAPTAATDAQGKFVLKEIEAGSYRLSFAANGYVRQEYGQKIFPGQGSLIDITAGQAMKGVMISMTPTANVSGRVFDAGKRPAAAVPVHLMRFTYDVNGRRLVQPAASTQTDDRGEYRVYFLTPGQYYLAAGTLREAMPARAFNGVMDSYAVTYYPGTADSGQATAIDIRPGAELQMDVSMSKQALYRIRGKIVDTRISQIPTSVIISLTPRGNSGGAPYEIMRDSLGYNPSDGTYEVRDVLPGSYLLTATWGDSITIPSTQMQALGVTAPTPGQPNNAFNVLREGVAYASVSVGTSDVENLALSIVPGGIVSGRLRLDNQGGASQNPRIQLKPSLDGLPANIPGVFAPRATPVNTDGTFSIPNIKAGEYRVAVEGLPNGYYVKEARVGPNDVLNRPFQFSAGDNAALEIIAAPGAPTISGTATNERGEAMAGALVALVPERQRDRVDLYKSELANSRGQFTLNSIPPGDYKVFAWEALEPNAFLNPDVLKQHDARGKIFHVQEGSAQTVDVRVIPAIGGF